MTFTRCSVCRLSDTDRTEANRLLATGEATHEQVAGLFGLSGSAVSRHSAEHLPIVQAIQRAEADVAPVIGTVEASDAAGMVGRLRQLDARLGVAYVAAEEIGWLDILPRIARERARLIELEDTLARRSGGDGNGASQAASEARGAVAALSAVVLAALSEHPEARERVAQALTQGAG